MPDQDTERYSLTRAQLYDLISLAAYPQTSYPHITFGNWVLREGITPQPAPDDAVTEAAVRCVKCGGSDIHTKYHQDSSPWYECHYGARSKQSREHLHRFCRGCSWDWTVPTVDRLLDAGESEVRE